MTQGKFKLDAQTINAMTSAMGAIVMCITDSMETEQRAAITRDFARLALLAEKNGDTLLETMLIDLHRASQ